MTNEKDNMIRCSCGQRVPKAIVENVLAERNRGNAPQMDWQQVALNGGPPCFALAVDADSHYCGRAQRWAGHDSHHKFVSLDDLLTTIRKRRKRSSVLGSR